MKRQWITVTVTIALSATALFALIGLMGMSRTSLACPAPAVSANRGDAASAATPPTVSGVDPAGAPNDIAYQFRFYSSNFTRSVFKARLEKPAAVSLQVQTA